MAGGLPDPIQIAVADAARVLPLPIPVPYPHARLSDPAPVDHPEVDTWSQPAPAEAMADEPEDSSEAPVATAAGDASSERPHLAVASDQRSCDSDEGGWHEGKEFNSACDELVAPPGFEQDVDRFDRDHDEDRDEEFVDRDRGSRADRLSEARDDDSDHRGHDESDRQEERHDHESPDDDSSTGRD
jgi:hypothetical protein